MKLTKSLHPFWQPFAAKYGVISYFDHDIASDEVHFNPNKIRVLNTDLKKSIWIISILRSSNYGDELAWSAAWLNFATDEASYLNAAEDHYRNFNLDYVAWAFSWDDKNAGVQVKTILYTVMNQSLYYRVFASDFLWKVSAATLTTDTCRRPFWIIPFPNSGNRIISVFNAMWIWLIPTAPSIQADLKIYLQ